MHARLARAIMNESIGDRESIRARGRVDSIEGDGAVIWATCAPPRELARVRLGQGPPPGSSSPRVAARGARGGQHPRGAPQRGPTPPILPRIPSGLLRVSRGPCSRRAIVAGPLGLAVLGFGPGPMGMAGAVYIVPSGHYGEVI